MSNDLYTEKTVLNCNFFLRIYGFSVHMYNKFETNMLILKILPLGVAFSVDSSNVKPRLDLAMKHIAVFALILLCPDSCCV